MQITQIGYQENAPQPFGHGGEINSSGLPHLFGIDLRATRFVLVQVELLEQFALPDQQVGQPAFMLEGAGQFQPEVFQTLRRVANCATQSA